jgi:hypothetical protein
MKYLLELFNRRQLIIKNFLLIFLVLFFFTGSVHAEPVGVFPDGRGNNIVYGPLQRTVIGQTGVPVNGALRFNPVNQNLETYNSTLNRWEALLKDEADPLFSRWLPTASNLFYSASNPSNFIDANVLRRLIELGFYVTSAQAPATTNFAANTINLINGLVIGQQGVDLDGGMRYNAETSSIEIYKQLFNGWRQLVSTDELQDIFNRGFYLINTNALPPPPLQTNASIVANGLVIGTDGASVDGAIRYNPQTGNIELLSNTDFSTWIPLIKSGNELDPIYQSEKSQFYTRDNPDGFITYTQFLFELSRGFSNFTLVEFDPIYQSEKSQFYTRDNPDGFIPEDRAHALFYPVDNPSNFITMTALTNFADFTALTNSILNFTTNLVNFSQFTNTLSNYGLYVLSTNNFSGQPAPTSATNILQNVVIYDPVQKSLLKWEATENRWTPISPVNDFAVGIRGVDGLPGSIRFNHLTGRIEQWITLDGPGTFGKWQNVGIGDDVELSQNPVLIYNTEIGTLQYRNPQNQNFTNLPGLNKFIVGSDGAEIPGAIRYNFFLKRLEQFVENDGWRNIGTGDGSGDGSGSGFPLVGNVSANQVGNQFGITDLGFLDFTGSTNLLRVQSNRLFFGSSEVGSGSGSLRTVIADGKTNTQIESLQFLEGNLIDILHNTNTPGRSVFTISYDGVPIQLTYRGEYDATKVYSTNQIVTISQFTGSPEETPIVGLNLFISAYVTKTNLPTVLFTNQTPTAQSAYWQPFASSGPRGSDGIGNIQFNPATWSSIFSYPSNTLVYFEDSLYLSITNVVPGTNGIAISDTAYWKRLLRSGLDGAPGTSTEIVYIFTNQTVSGLQFRGDYMQVPSIPNFFSNDVVTYFGSAYFTPVNLPGDEYPSMVSPPAPPWILFSAKGEDGNQGGSVVSNLIFTTPLDYSGSAFYVSNSVVRFEGSLWVARTNVDQSGGAIKLPPINILDSVTIKSNQFWELLVARGDKGQSGGIQLDGAFKNNFNLFEPGGYNQNDLVYYENALWRAKQAISQPAPLPRVPSIYWELLISSGRDGAGGATFNYVGEWQLYVSGVPTRYYVNDLVRWTPIGGNELGGLWRCRIEHNNNESGSQPTRNSIYWEPVVQDGVDGVSFDLNYRGQWQSGGTYFTNDLVKHPLVFPKLWRPSVNISPSLIPPAAPQWEVVVEGITGNQGPGGAPGLPGAVGPKGDPGANLVFVGDWTNDPNIVYVAFSNLVAFSNDVYYPIITINGGITNGSPANPAFWRKFLSSGKDGKDGIGNMFFAGPWSTNRAYATNEMVSFSNAVYVATQQVLNVISPTNTQFWLKLFEGLPGPTGISITNASVINSNLIVYLSNASQINAGSVIGPRGERGDPGADLTFVGVWTNTRNYTVSNLVTHLGSSWYSTHNNNSNNAPSQSTTNWIIFSQRGDVGPIGPTGQIFYVEAASTITVTGTPAAVSNNIVGTTNRLTFYIPRGEVGERGPVGASLVLAGTWTNTTAYAPSSIVFHVGSSWYNTQTSSNQQPGVSPAWGLFASGEGTADLTNYLYLAGGGSLSTTGRQPGMFIQYAGGNQYVHEFSSINWVFAPGLTNHPVSGLRFVPGSGMTIEHSTNVEQIVYNNTTSFVDISTITLTSAGGGGGGVTNLYDLNLVDAVNPQEGQVLKFIGGVWTNAEDIATGGGGSITGAYVQSINSLTGAVQLVAGQNVEISSVGNNQIQISADFSVTLEGASNATFIALGNSTDGLVGFNTNETVYTAINTFDSIFSEIAPSNALPLNALSVSGYTPFSTKLSIIDAESVTYPPGYSFGTVYTPVSKGDGTFIIANTPSQTTFNFADRGFLQLYINNTNRDTLNLGARFNPAEKSGAQSWPVTNGFGTNGIFDMVSVEKYGISTWQKGLVNVIVSNQLLRNGFNSFYIVHSNATFTRVSQSNVVYYDWSPATQTHHAVTITNQINSTNWLSGIAYASNFNVIVGATISNLFKNTYRDTDTIEFTSAFTGIGTRVFGMNANFISGVTIPPTNTQTLSINSATLSSTGQYSAVVVPVNLRSRNGYGDIVTTSQTFSNYLVNSFSQVQDSNNIELFNNEYRRLPNNFNFNSFNDSIAGVWTSTAPLVNGQLQQSVFGYNENHLVYPQINFTSGFSPPQTANYSGFSGTQIYYRAFTTDLTVQNVDLLLTGNFGVSDIDTVGNGALNVEIKLGDATRTWKDAQVAVLLGGARREFPQAAGGVLTLRLTFGTDSISQFGGRFYVRISYRPSASNKYLSRLEARFP